MFELPDPLEAEKYCLLPQDSSFCSIESLLAARQLRLCVKKQVTQHNYRAAIALLDRLIACYPNSAMDYNNRGLMYFYAGQLSEALQDYDTAIALDKKLAPAYNNRANFYATQKNFLAALNDYEIALDLNPTNIRALFNQGITFRELELYDLAIENFEMALLLGQTLQGRLYAERGYTYHLRGDWNCAIGDYYRALDRLSDRDPYRQKVQNWLNDLLS
jgi:tetratricopeptide (TPR) repeat protein